MIKFVNGNIFDVDVDLYVNTVNCVGVMGKGLALQFKNKYPRMYEDYKNMCDNNEIYIGCCTKWYDILNSKMIVNFPTKIHWRDPSKYEYIEKGLLWLVEYVKNSTCSMAIPALGCSEGGLDWIKVKALINKYLSKLENDITVFRPLN